MLCLNTYGTPDTAHFHLEKVSSVEFLSSLVSSSIEDYNVIFYTWGLKLTVSVQVQVQVQAHHLRVECRLRRLSRLYIQSYTSTASHLACRIPSLVPRDVESKYIRYYVGFTDCQCSPHTAIVHTLLTTAQRPLLQATASESHLDLDGLPSEVFCVCGVSVGHRHGSRECFAAARPPSRSTSPTLAARAQTRAPPPAAGGATPYGPPKLGCAAHPVAVGQHPRH